MNKIKQLRDLLKEDPRKLAEQAKQRFIEKGFIWNEVYGWEKPEILERFGLDPNMTGIPTIQTEEGYDIHKGWLDYQQYKKDKMIRDAKIRTAERYNTPPIEAYVDN